MLAMPALEFGDPVPIRVLVKSGDSALHPGKVKGGAVFRGGAEVSIRSWPPAFGPGATPGGSGVAALR
jgi:hypothetical protein